MHEARRTRGSFLRVVATTVFLAAALIGVSAGPASASVTSVSGGAYGYQTFVGLFGGPPELRGPAGSPNCTGTTTTACTPTVVLPSSGSPSVTASDPDGAVAGYGPAVLHRSVAESVGTQGTIGPLGSVSSNASITFPSQAIQDGPVFADGVSSSCTASESGQSGSTTLNNVSLALSTYPTGHWEEGGPRITIPIPSSPAPNTEYEGVLDHIGNDERFRIVFNEQIRTADSITVSAFHMYLMGEIAVGEYIAAQSRCGVASSVANAAPIAVNDSYNALDGVPLTISPAAGLLANDSDPTGQALSARKPTPQPVPTSPQIDCFSTNAGACGGAYFFPNDVHHGTVVVNIDGSFTYTSNPGYTGPDSFQYVVNDPRGGGATGTVSITVALASAGTFTALTPARILDTRSAAESGTSTPVGTCTPSPCARVAAGAPVEVQVAGRGGVPATGVSAVVMNVTVTGPTAASYLTVWPSDATQPTASNLNYSAGQTVPNQVTVKLSATGTVKIANATGTTHVLADVAGWYAGASASPSSRYNPLTPARILDSRSAAESGTTTPVGTCTPSPCARVAAGTPATVQVAGQGNVPATGVTAVVLNVTVTGPTADSYLTVWPADATQPTASNLNFSAGQTVPNLVTVKLSPGGAVKIANASGNTNVIADVAGWYGVAGAATGSRFTPVTPGRLLDTRSAAESGTSTPVGKCATSTTSGPCSRVQAGTPIFVDVAGRAGVPNTGANAVVMNVTVTGPTADSFLTVWPSDATQPTASNLNFSAGQTVPNLVAVRLSPSGLVKIANYSGSTHVIADVAGWFN